MSRSLAREYTIGVRARKLPGARLYCLRDSALAHFPECTSGTDHINRPGFEKEISQEKNNKRISYESGNQELNQEVKE